MQTTISKLENAVRRRNALVEAGKQSNGGNYFDRYNQTMQAMGQLNPYHDRNVANLATTAMGAVRAGAEAMNEHDKNVREQQQYRAWREALIEAYGERFYGTPLPKAMAKLRPLEQTSSDLIANKGGSKFPILPALSRWLLEGNKTVDGLKAAGELNRIRKDIEKEYVQLNAEITENVLDYSSEHIDYGNIAYGDGKSTDLVELRKRWQEDQGLVSELNGRIAQLRKDFRYFFGMDYVPAFETEEFSRVKGHIEQHWEQIVKRFERSTRFSDAISGGSGTSSATQSGKKKDGRPDYGDDLLDALKDLFENIERFVASHPPGQKFTATDLRKFYDTLAVIRQKREGRTLRDRDRGDMWVGVDNNISAIETQLNDLLKPDVIRAGEEAAESGVEGHQKAAAKAVQQNETKPVPAPSAKPAPANVSKQQEQVTDQNAAQVDPKGTGETNTDAGSVNSQVENDALLSSATSDPSEETASEPTVNPASEPEAIPQKVFHLDDQVLAPDHFFVSGFPGKKQKLEDVRDNNGPVVLQNEREDDYGNTVYDFLLSPNITEAQFNAIVFGVGSLDENQKQDPNLTRLASLLGDYFKVEQQTSRTTTQHTTSVDTPFALETPGRLTKLMSGGYNKKQCVYVDMSKTDGSAEK
jgi:hypothetical protein